ncbi:MFS transporter [Proteiniphilum sp. X52]|uniref:MFS transporter n=1 Tax=Proteiniphilum sp. X52 TaxID=2382159 RepID=UPI000F09C7E1|nr:MFS transporter [Proteiniphilum sp. X52]RNC65781.1 MFS transporter [Proteiniphilum sp. X52]
MKIKNLPKDAWLTVGLLFVVGLLNYLDRTMIATMRSSIVEGIPMTEAQFGLLTSVFLWVYSLLSPFAGFMADRFSRSKVIIGSLFVWSLVTWFTSHASTYDQLLATRALMGISEAFYVPAALALILDYHPGSTQSRATGLHMTGIMLGQSLGFIGGWLAENHTWQYAFHIFGIIGILYAFFLLFILKDAPKENVAVKEQDEIQGKVDQKDTVKFGLAMLDLLSRKSFVYLFVFWGVMGVVGWMIMAWLPTYYKEQFNLSQTLAGFYATAYLYPASIAGLLIGAFWSDKWSKKNNYARILVPMIGLGIAALAVFFGSFTTVLTVAIVFFLIYGLSRMFVDTNLMPILSLTVDKRYRATGYGILNMFATLIGGLGIYVGGALRDSNFNLKLVYQFASVSILICIVLLWLVKKYTKTAVE